MKILDVLELLNSGNAFLQGTTRPVAGVQLDRWKVEGKTFLVTGSKQWNPNTTMPNQKVNPNYSTENIIRIEECIEIQ